MANPFKKLLPNKSRAIKLVYPKQPIFRCDIYSRKNSASKYLSTYIIPCVAWTGLRVKLKNKT